MRRELCNCPWGHFNNSGKCEECNNIASILFIFGSFMSFVLIAWHANMIATDRKKMMLLRVFSTFFQTAEITTLVLVEIG